MAPSSLTLLSGRYYDLDVQVTQLIPPDRSPRIHHEVFNCETYGRRAGGVNSGGGVGRSTHHHHFHRRVIASHMSIITAAQLHHGLPDIDQRSLFIDDHHHQYAR